MKLETAIERLQAYIFNPYQAHNVDVSDAIKLGIEALKQIHDHRSILPPQAIYLLLGETEE